jgi:hypothetical protein
MEEEEEMQYNRPLSMQSMFSLSNAFQYKEREQQFQFNTLYDFVYEALLLCDIKP